MADRCECAKNSTSSVRQTEHRVDSSQDPTPPPHTHLPLLSQAVNRQLPSPRPTPSESTLGSCGGHCPSSEDGTGPVASGHSCELEAVRASSELCSAPPQVPAAWEDLGGMGLWICGGRAREVGCQQLMGGRALWRAGKGRKILWRRTPRPPCRDGASDTESMRSGARARARATRQRASLVWVSCQLHPGFGRAREECIARGMRRHRSYRQIPARRVTPIGPAMIWIEQKNVRSKPDSL